MGDALSATEARERLYEVMGRDLPFEEKATLALSVGETYLSVENGHLTRIDPESDYWRAIASTDPEGGTFPAGLQLDLRNTYCRLAIDGESPVRLHDAPEQGLADDPAFQRYGLHCYHGSAITIDGELFGTLCFVSMEPRAEPFDEAETLFAELIARMLETELQEARTDAKIDRLDQFASVVSHDLRSPLNVAQGRVDIERSSRDSEHLEIAARSLDRMEDLIADVLTVARQGQEVEETELLSLDAVVEECWDAVRTDDASLSVAADLRFKADPSRVRHLFENLFRNAIEHGGDDVSIRVGPLDDGGGFYVEDDGPGIPEADRERVFKTGFTTGSEGIGLGLAIVEGVVEAHGWRIAVEEGADGGARFEVSDVVAP
ncbi:histidine kinase [Halorubrum sp. E3]|uniref:histidine kinase n=1 Tax=Halorubrum persicum TaxID=1383844 RepID=A0A2G1WEL9_9EURY|nr:ATP-binding protein [Halorubrum persicum]OYR78641.1 histidine kinase [Halorubrum sp. E3]PHQ37436.1 histidine kinase [Halorubrum persicum]